MQQGHVKLPLADWRVTPDTLIGAHDLLSDETYLWRDEWTYVRLDPQTRVAHVIAVRLLPAAAAQPPVTKSDV